MRKQRRPQRLAAATLLATAVSVGSSMSAPVSAHPPSGPTDGELEALRQCESDGDYGINTGNGYYGAYQFALSTWRGLGYGGYPHHAPPEVQDEAARRLQSLYGWGQWPACSRSLDLR